MSPSAIPHPERDAALRGLVREHAGLAAFVDRDRAWQACVDVVTRTLGDVAWIAELDHDDPHGGAVLRHLDGHRTPALRALQIPPGHGLTGKVFGLGRTEWVDDYFATARITHTFDTQIADEGIRRLLAVPVVADGRTLGVLAVGVRSDGAFGSVAAQHAGTIADEIARAVEVADRARAAREAAVHAERSRLAAELHDSVGALLFAIGSGMAGLVESSSADPVLRARLEQLRGQAVEASTALRDSMRTLRASPTALELAVALRADCTAFTERTGTPAELVMLDDNLALDPTRRDIAVTAVREALHNVEKHAGAHGVVVTVCRRTPERLVIAVTDDGVGMAPDCPQGIGLATTADAVGRVGGLLTLAGDPDGGTTWRIELPC
ncbi:GAF domain-containing protein [Pseudonocardia sp. WMMC193]|uniref:GAF domain-containing sensor histidine kinase n=1 Tax=Pseudonocardia sp. WMMC193 TaxID=2911965 RepID=UPI001F0101BD|nr:GAF domain-containing protein [Pseudonocardia sp. WMMC193]MCF7549317.1 GAF domain-containing protein [Pseudonocardia sp. WMMC193]